MNNQIAPTTATYQNAYTAETIQSDLPEQSTKKQFLSYRTKAEPDVQKLINKNQAKTKVLEGKIQTMQKKLTECLQHRTHETLFIKPPPVPDQNTDQNNGNSPVTNSIANKPLTPSSEDSTTTDVRPEITGLPPSTTDSTVSPPSLSATDNASPPSIPTHTTANDSSAKAITTPSGNTTQATNATSTLIPTTALPPLKELISDSVKLTLMASLRNKLAEYQQQQNRLTATAQNYLGNITGLAQQPDNIIGVRQDDPSLLIRHLQQQSQSTVDLSALISNIEKRVEMYELFNLVLMVSSFAEAIKKSFPAVAAVYDNELKQLTDEINNYVLNHNQGDTKSKRTRRTLARELTEALLEVLIKFEKTPMTNEMQVFFKGFEETRNAFAKALYNGDTITDDPEFKEMFEWMKNKNTILKGLKKYNDEIEQAIANSNYYRVGQITFSVNLLHHKVQNTLNNYASENPYFDLLQKIRRLEFNNVHALQSLTDKAAASVPLLKEFIIEALAQDALDLAFDSQIEKGFCAGDVMATAIAGRYGMFTNSLVSLAKSILFGYDYSRLPIQIRMTLQDALYYAIEGIPYNHPDSVGQDSESIYIEQIIHTANRVVTVLEKLTDSAPHGFNSLSQLIDKLLEQIPVDSLGTELVQFVVDPTSHHFCYFAFSKSNNLFRLTVQDYHTGVTTVTGTTLEQLKTAIPNALEQFAREFNIPLRPGPHTAPLPGRSFARLTNALLDPLENMELIKDSALTVKDIVTHHPSQLKELDKERIGKLTTKYLDTVKNDATRKLLRINLKSLSQSESADLAKFAQMPMVYLMREVLTFITHPNPVEHYGSSKFNDIRLMNAHAVTTLHNIAKHLTSAPKKTADADAQSVPQGAAKATTDLATSTAGELVKLAIERDFSLLVPEPVAGAVTAQPGGAHAAPENTAPEHAAPKSHGSRGKGISTGGKIGGGLASFATAVVGPLVLFRLSCPGCLTEMASELTESVGDRLTNALNRVSQNSEKQTSQTLAETRQSVTSPTTGTAQNHPRKRRDLSGRPAVSGASQHKGMLAGALQTLGQLAGYLNPLSLGGNAPPGVSGNLHQRSNTLLTPLDYPVASTLILANLLAAKVSGRPALPQRFTAAADTRQIGQRLNATSPMDHLPAKTIPLTRELASGNYDKAQSGFMKLPLSEQLELLVLLDKQPDHLGQNSCSGPLRQLQADARSLAAANAEEIGTRTPDWQSFRLSQRAWQLFTHLHDTRVEAFGEAINQQKITERIIREGIEQNQDNAHYLGQLVVQLLPHRTSASEQASLMATGTESMPTVAGLHRFTTKGITDILSSYRTIKSLVSEQFPKLFGNMVNDPQLQNELIAQIARTSLQELRGKTTADGWQQVVRDHMLAEFREWL
ncbi:hypothetical protein [Endozoicomonas acroporae]|uniref:hypothetical protein n=1 Tax=Endozoicomonas acroporae TaxID=1701104 RepID=UPI003D79EF28